MFERHPGWTEVNRKETWDSSGGTLLLLKPYGERKGTFPHKPHSKVFEEIAVAMTAVNSASGTGCQCQTKISSLKGTNHETRKMGSIFGGKAWLEVPAKPTSDKSVPPTSVSHTVSSSRGASFAAAKACSLYTYGMVITHTSLKTNKLWNLS
ncbi:uncharacterized protein LOC124164318 isoform X2 [Ischnura elegans]|uniref:uncharacterized protein LOC124164318 isoform X2 n=1 Tax=Ischnura elegans TaxID=197161 RepID=UPI001ED88D8F|nr:uncharacterized protein LOC124164318 isoform X2 [Ischnura elegans]